MTLMRYQQDIFSKDRVLITVLAISKVHHKLSAVIVVQRSEQHWALSHPEPGLFSALSSWKHQKPDQVLQRQHLPWGGQKRIARSTHSYTERSRTVLLQLHVFFFFISIISLMQQLLLLLFLLPLNAPGLLCNCCYVSFNCAFKTRVMKLFIFASYVQ